MFVYSLYTNKKIDSIRREVLTTVTPKNSFSTATLDEITLNLNMF